MLCQERLRVERLRAATHEETLRYVRGPEARRMAKVADALGARMAANPAYFANPIMGVGIVPATNDTSLTAPTHTTMVYTGSTTTTIATAIWEIDMIATATTAAGYVNIFLYNQTTYYLYDEAPIPAVTVALGGNVAVWKKTYANLFIPGAATAWELVVTTTNATNESNINVFAFGATQ
jgi:hypothetical protein